MADPGVFRKRIGVYSESKQPREMQIFRPYIPKRPSTDVDDQVKHLHLTPTLTLTLTLTLTFNLTLTSQSTTVHVMIQYVGKVLEPLIKALRDPSCAIDVDPSTLNGFNSLFPEDQNVVRECFGEIFPTGKVPFTTPETTTPETNSPMTSKVTIQYWSATTIFWWLVLRDLRRILLFHWPRARAFHNSNALTQ